MTPFDQSVVSESSGRLHLHSIIALGAIVVTTISTLVFGVLALQRESTSLADQAGLRLVNQATSVAHALNDSFDERLRQIELLASWAMADLRGATDRVAAPVQREALDSMLAFFDGLVWLGVTNATGEVQVASGGLLEGMSIADRPVFIGGMLRAFVGDRHRASRLQSSLRPDRPAWEVLDVGAPIKAQGGALAGVVVAHLDWDWFLASHRQVFSTRRLDAGGEAWLLDRDGELVSGTGHLDADASARRLPQAINDRIVALAAQGGGWTRVTWVDGRDVFVGVSAVAVGGGHADFAWTSVVIEDAALALANVRETMLWLTLVSLLVMGLAFLIARGLAARIVAPLRRLVDVTRSLKDHPSSDIPIVGGYREAVELSTALQSLIHSLGVVSSRLAVERTRSTRDALTQLLNRHALDDIVERAAAESLAAGESLALVHIDLDGFKPINDRYGHAVGDAALREVATRLLREIRHHDFAFRLGGDEFFVVLRISSFTPDLSAFKLVDRLLRVIESPFTVPEMTEPLRLGATAGVAIWPERLGHDSAEPTAAASPKTTWQAVMVRADEALIAGKQQEKGRVYMAP
ncbi:MAG: diguanylate cyclase domain-containing protein [Thioalkalivibrionaceae bacterium]